MLTILQQIATFAKSLHADLTKLHDALNEQARAIHESAEAHKNRNYSPPVIRAELQIPETVKTHKTRDDTQKRGEEIFKIIIQVLTLLFVGIYTVFTYELLDLSHKSLTTVQRAFISFPGTQLRRFANSTPNGENWVFDAPFVNSGTTFGVQTIKMLFVGEAPNGLAEDRFIGSEADVAGAKTQPGIVGPKDQRVLGPIFQTDQFVLGDWRIDWNKLKGNPQSVLISRHVLSWGWVIYRDVFPKTPRHLTEFCQELSAVIMNPKDQTITVPFSDCGSHNCTDEYCDDYKQLLDFVDRAKQKVPLSPIDKKDKILQ